MDDQESALSNCPLAPGGFPNRWRLEIPILGGNFSTFFDKMRREPENGCGLGKKNLPRLQGSSEGRSFRRTLKTRHLAGQNFFLKISPNCNFSRVGGLYRAPKFLKLKINIFLFFFILGSKEGRPPGGLGGGASPGQNPLNYAFSPKTTPVIVQATCVIKNFNANPSQKKLGTKK